MKLSMGLIQVCTRLREDEAQDLIEYALVVALIAFAAIVGMQSVAGNINNAFSNIGTLLSSTTA